jgi:hypothetical protein
MSGFCVGGVGSSVDFGRAGRVWVKVIEDTVGPFGDSSRKHAVGTYS